MTPVAIEDDASYAFGLGQLVGEFFAEFFKGAILDTASSFGLVTEDASVGPEWWLRGSTRRGVGV